MTRCSIRRSSMIAPEARRRGGERFPDDEDIRGLYKSDSYIYTYSNRSLATDDTLLRVSRDQHSFRFHKNAGTNITICDNNTTAKTKIPGTVGHGLLFSCQPMRLGYLYEVRVKHVMSEKGSEMSVGVCFRDPDYITVPAYASSINRNTGVILSHRQCDGETNCNDPRRRLVDIPDGQRVGMLVDSQLWLHLYINGVDCGPLTQLNHTFFFAMFELYCGVEEVYSLPVQEEP
ncbi:neuralized-like protein 4 [Pomacea canaliculata]|uniref:neuralized-like protein 4 n=1 Tax=Pomacea canaliculata TaxID=400727 RepID=UPI000D7299F0|nr:neuralized-like protein 4 [Pomacea canaliculata]